VQWELKCFYGCSEYIYTWAGSKFSEFFCDGPIKEAHCKKQKKINSDLGRHSKTNFHIDHTIQFSTQQIFNNLKPFGLAFKIQLRVVGQKKGRW
jgi:hypothetical protein